MEELMKKLKIAEKYNQNYSINEISKILEQEHQCIAELEQEFAELKEKDNYHLRYELAGADETITNLRQQLEEKDKEIDRLKDFIACEGCVDVIKKSNEDQTQLAISELEKVKEKFGYKHNSQLVVSSKYLVDFIDNQIKKLKGE